VATRYWLGQAAVVAQVQTGSIDTLDGTPANNTFTVTIGGVAVSAVGATNPTTTATNLRASLNASTHPYFAAITWSGSGGNIVGTADTSGVPFVAALTVSGAGTGTVTDFAMTTANSGPNDWSVAANWSAATVPVSADDVIIKDNAVNICWGFAQSAVELTSLRIDKSYTGMIGLRRDHFATSADAETLNVDYVEYRPTYLSIASTTVALGANLAPGTPTGSQRMKIDLGSAVAATVDIFDTAQASAEAGMPAIRLKAANASTDIFVRFAPGGVGVAVDVPGETSTVRKVSVSDTSTASRVFLGAGTTITTWDQSGGDNILQAAGTVTTITVSGGILLNEGAAAVTTANVYGGNFVSNSTGTITTLVLNGGNVDFQKSNRARTVTTCNLTRGELKANGTNLTITNLNDPANNYTLQVA